MNLPGLRPINYDRGEMCYTFLPSVVDTESLIARIRRATPFISNPAQTMNLAGAARVILSVGFIGNEKIEKEEDPYLRNERLVKLASENPHPNARQFNKLMYLLNDCITRKDTILLLDVLDQLEDLLNENAEEREASHALFVNTYINSLESNEDDKDRCDLLEEFSEIKYNDLPEIFDPRIFSQIKHLLKVGIDLIKGNFPLDKVTPVLSKINQLIEFNQAKAESKRKLLSPPQDQPEAKKVRIITEDASEGSDSYSESSSVSDEPKRVRFAREVYVDELLKVSSAFVSVHQRLPVSVKEAIPCAAQTIINEDYEMFDEYLKNIRILFNHYALCSPSQIQIQNVTAKIRRVNNSFYLADNDAINRIVALQKINLI